jgi:hypothetical protein
LGGGGVFWERIDTLLLEQSIEEIYPMLMQFASGTEGVESAICSQSLLATGLETIQREQRSARVESARNRDQRAGPGGDWSKASKLKGTDGSRGLCRQ